MAIGLSGQPGASAAAPAASASRMVYLRGPGDPGCPADLARAKARGDAGELFLTEFKCRVHAGWKCGASCKADELLVTHVTLKVERNGQPSPGQVIRNSESRDFDDMCVGAVKAGAPFPAPPAALLDASGSVPLKIEFVCDCAQRPHPTK
jgi:hypothetical protein